jgi:hypothetical protein
MQWHQQDPVSAKEIARNDSIYKIQNNRNPFIDNPIWVNAIWAQDAGIEELYTKKLTIFPNPVNNYFELQIANTDNCHINIYSYTGKLITELELKGNIVYTDNLTPGLYYFIGHQGQYSFKGNFIKQ